MSSVYYLKSGGQALFGAKAESGPFPSQEDALRTATAILALRPQARIELVEMTSEKHHTQVSWLALITRRTP